MHDCNSSCLLGFLSWACLKMISCFTSCRRRISIFLVLLSWRWRRMEGWSLLYTISSGVRFVTLTYSPMCQESGNLRAWSAKAYILAEKFAHFYKTCSIVSGSSRWKHAGVSHKSGGGVTVFLLYIFYTFPTKIPLGGVFSTMTICTCICTPTHVG